MDFVFDLQVIPRGVLTESVSFGRFASETLQWAKWSAFTQNRYLEEVERFTKPGSVAEKKAFFEAHFKNRASGNTTTTKTVCEVVQKENLIDSEVRHGDVVKTSHETVCEVVVVKENLLPLVDEEVSNAEVGSVPPPSVSVTEATVADLQIGEVKDTIAENIDSMAVDEDEELDKVKMHYIAKPMLLLLFFLLTSICIFRRILFLSAKKDVLVLPCLFLKTRILTR